MYQCINAVLVSDCICMENNMCAAFIVVTPYRPINIGVPMVCRDISLFTRLICYNQARNFDLGEKCRRTHACTLPIFGSFHVAFH